MSPHFDGTEPREWHAAMTMVGRSIAATVGPRVPRHEDDLRLADELDIDDLCDGDMRLICKGASDFTARKWWRL